MIFGKRAFFGYFVSPPGEIWWFATPQREGTQQGRPGSHND
jgi:hypothetical protein